MGDTPATETPKPKRGRPKGSTNKTTAATKTVQTTKTRTTPRNVATNGASGTKALAKELRDYAAKCDDRAAKARAAADALEGDS